MILCCGEALIDMLPRQTRQGEDTFLPVAGGAVFNTAIALGRLGAGVGFFSGISTDMFGEVLVKALKASHVDSHLCKRTPKPTTLAFVELVGGQARYAFYDENTAGRLLRPEDLPMLPEDVEALFFGGISLVSEPCGSAYERLMLQMAPTAVTMIDPNIRPAFVTDEPAYRARINRMIGAADIVKVSDEDLRWLLGTGEIDALARAMLALGPNLVFVTEGSRGAHGFTRTDTAFAPAEKVDVVDTVGAGDTFNAGALAQLSADGLLRKEAIAALSTDQIAGALRLGIRAASVVVARAGANPPWLAELR